MSILWTDIQWINGTRSAIDNVMLSDMAADLIDEDFSYFLKKNKVDILSTIN